MESVPVVLVVEHEEPLQEIVHDALKEGDFDLTTVASGREAVAYSALVTDVNLKGSMKGKDSKREETPMRVMALALHFSELY